MTIALMKMRTQCWKNWVVGGGANPVLLDLLVNNREKRPWVVTRLSPVEKLQVCGEGWEVWFKISKLIVYLMAQNILLKKRHWVNTRIQHILKFQQARHNCAASLLSPLQGNFNADFLFDQITNVVFSFLQARDKNFELRKLCSLPNYIFNMICSPSFKSIALFLKFYSHTICWGGV